MKATVTLNGPKEDVLSVLGLALESGIIESLSSESEVTAEASKVPYQYGEKQRRNRENTGASTKGRRGPDRTTTAQLKEQARRRLALFNPGARVMVEHIERKRYPSARLGRTGTVLQAVRSGKGVAVEVKWDDNLQSTWVAARLLKKLRDSLDVKK